MTTLSQSNSQNNTGKTDSEQEFQFVRKDPLASVDNRLPKRRQQNQNALKIPLSPTRESRLSMVLEQVRSKRRKQEPETLQDKANALANTIQNTHVYPSELPSTPQRVEPSVDLTNHRELSAVSTFVNLLPAASRDAIMPLPVQDTPAIERNKNLRERADDEGGRNRRKSSMARGRRSSAALSGLCHIPHPDVAVEDYHRHIQPDLSEPQRMKQLLVWCGEKAMDGQQVARQGKVGEDVLQLCKDVEEAVIGGMIRGQIECSWYHRKRDPQEDVPQVTKPHPRNVDNLKRLAEFEQTIARLTKEEQMWVKCLQERNTMHASAVDQYPSTTQLRPFAPQDLDLNVLSEKELSLVQYAFELDQKKQDDMMLDETNPDKPVEEVEQKVHHLQDVLDRVATFEDVTRKYCEDLYSRLLKIFEARNSTMATTAEPKDVLLALSKRK